MTSVGNPPHKVERKKTPPVSVCLSRVQCLAETLSQEVRTEPRRMEKIHNKELHNLYSSPNVIRAIKSIGEAMNGTYKTRGETRN
jgi:hypothetical protein